MLKWLSISIWCKRRFNRRFRLAAAFLFAFSIIGLLLFYVPTVAPRYMFTLADRFSVLTPKGFYLGQLYNFNTLSYENNVLSTQGSDEVKELVLPRPDNHMIIFKYPQVVTLGRPTYLSNDISQSVDFTVKEPPASGLIQIWVLTTPLDDFLETSKNYSTVEYITFSNKKEKRNDLSYTLWDYTFKSGDKTIHGLEAFFDDKPYMYRISIFLNHADYDEKIQTLFDEMVQTVTVK